VESDFSVNAYVARSRHILVRGDSWFGVKVQHQSETVAHPFSCIA
jgi:hypothetical protein